jgi:hypothetical protein
MAYGRGGPRISERNPAPFSLMTAIMFSRSRVERARRSSRATSTTSHIRAPAGARRLRGDPSGRQRSSDLSALHSIATIERTWQHFS